MSKKTNKHYTDYYTAIHWSGTCIMCNNLPDIDETVYDNAEFNWTYGKNNEYTRDVYQWMLTPWSNDTKEYMKRTFPELLITYSELLDLYVVCVDHFGTPWKGIPTECSESWFEHNEDKEYKGL